MDLLRHDRAIEKGRDPIFPITIYKDVNGNLLESKLRTINIPC